MLTILMNIGIYIGIGIFIWLLTPVFYHLFPLQRDRDGYHKQDHMTYAAPFIIFWPIPILYIVLNFPFNYFCRFAKSWIEYWG